MAWSESATGVAARRFARAQRAVVWLRSRRDLVVALTVAGVAVSFLLDLVIPGYAIAGLYLVPLLLVAFVLRERRVVVLVGVLCLVLTVLMMIIQGRANSQNILLIVFGALAGGGLIALGSMYQRFDELYENERSTTARLHSLAAQLQRLQEVSVLDSDRPLSELLLDVVVQARQLLESDGGRLFRFEAADNVLSLQAADGLSDVGAATLALPIGDDPIGRAVSARRPVPVPDFSAREGADHDPDTSCGACLVVPLVVRNDVYGVIALYYSHPRPFDDDDVGLASSFGDQAALAIENARLREKVERGAVAAERSRLARELHDSVTQSLFAASLKAEALTRVSDLTAPQARENLHDVQHLTRGALAEMRTLLLEMRPGALAQSFLADLLEHLTQTTQARTRAVITLTAGERVPLPSDVTVALFRIAQEAMNNMVRHAHAHRAWVTLSNSDDAVRLMVGDDGRGFDRSAVGPEQLGLRIMGERAEAVGAHLEICSEIGLGATITVKWSAGQGKGE